MKRKSCQTKWRRILNDAKTRDLTPTECAREQGVSISTVYNATSALGVQLKLYKRKAGSWIDVLEDAQARGLRVRDVAHEQGVSPACVTMRAQYHGIFLTGQRGLRTETSRAL